MSASYDIRTVKYLGGYRLRLTFADGIVGELDLSSKFERSVGAVFEPLRDQEFSPRSVSIPNSERSPWPNGADLAPDVLHDQAAHVA